MAVYIVDKPFGDVAFELAKLDEEAELVLLKDGVYLDTSSVSDKKIYAVKEDVEKRGLKERIKAELIDWSELVDLIVANKVMNFC